jgi:hypothetical protein
VGLLHGCCTSSLLKRRAAYMHQAAHCSAATYCASKVTLFKDQQGYSTPVHVVLRGSVQEARERMSGRQQTGSMQNPASGLPRISLPRTLVNSGSRSRARCDFVRKVCAALKEESCGRVRPTSRRQDLVRGRGAGRAGRPSARRLLRQRNLETAAGGVCRRSPNLPPRAARPANLTTSRTSLQLYIPVSIVKLCPKRRYRQETETRRAEGC